ncbi:MAG: thioredoxin-like domain-containing protein [Brumimicrobium sp.]
MKLIITLIFGILFTGFSYSQNLSFTIKGVEDTVVHLIKYVGNKLYYADTANIISGKVTFDGSKQEQGMLAVMMPDQSRFDFIHAGENVVIETSSPNYIENMVVKESKENKAFMDYVIRMKHDRDAATKLQEQRNALGEDQEAEKEKINHQIEAIGKELVNYQKKIIQDNPNSLIAKIIRMAMDVQVPEKPEDNEDPAYAFKYTRAHYFDNTDFQDDRLVNTPILQSRLEHYYKNMIAQHPDSIIAYITPVLDLIPKGTMMYRFFVTNITGHYEKSKIMGMDKVWNTMVYRYYCSQENGNYNGYWMDAEKLDDLCKDTKKRLRIMIGDVPPNLILPDANNEKWYNLHELDAEYTILYFWDPNCGHCKKVTPKLGELYSKKLKDRNVEIFAVGKATGDDYEDWKEFIRKNNLEFINVGVTEQLYKQAKTDPHSVIPSKTTLESLNYQDTYDIYSTPRVFVLDKDKKIIAKSLSVAQIEHMLDELQEGHKDDPKLFELEEPDDAE